MKGQRGPEMDRIFLDANVLFSAAYGSPGIQRLWDMARNGQCKIIASAYVIEEARRNLESPEHLSRLERLIEEIEVVPESDPEMPCPIALAEKDRPVVIAAIQAGATHLLTGDLKHFRSHLGQVVQGLRIQTPREYLNRLSR